MINRTITGRVTGYTQTNGRTRIDSISVLDPDDVVGPVAEFVHVDHVRELLRDRRNAAQAAQARRVFIDESGREWEFVRLREGWAAVSAWPDDTIVRSLKPTPYTDVQKALAAFVEFQGLNV